MIANTLAYQRELMLKKQNQTLLLMAKNLFSQLSNLNTLLSEIMNEARSLTKAERWVCQARRNLIPTKTSSVLID